jgi:ABC-type dipeptide/oligopeptide/nickel transport system permease subunit
MHAPKKTKLGILFWISVGFLALLAILAIFGPMMLPEYSKTIGTKFLGPMSAPSDLDPEIPRASFLFGTDQIGRSILARIAYGARISLSVGLIVQTIALLIGIIMGVLGVFAPKWIRIPVLRLTDAMFAFPDLLLAILIIGVAGLGMKPVIIALAITAWPAVARLVRTQVASLKDREFVVASQALGAKTGYMVVSWGSMINSAREQMVSHPIMMLWPCLFLSASIFALNFVGDGLRELADPKSDVN